MEIISRIFQFLKLSPKYIFALIIFSSIILFSPDNFLVLLNLKEFKDTYYLWISIVFLGSISILIAHVIFLILDKIRFYYLIYKHKKELKYLTPQEKKILKNYIENDLIADDLSITNGVVRALEAKMILVRSSSISKVGGYFPYNIQPWAFKYLKKHTELLD